MSASQTAASDLSSKTAGKKLWVQGEKMEEKRIRDDAKRREEKIAKGRRG